MRKYVAFFLLLAFACGFAGCAFPTGPDFKDFSAYKDDFSLVRDCLLAQDFFQNSTDHILVNLNSDIAEVIDVEAETKDALLASVARLCAKGFNYVILDPDYMIFWEDETGYYGVLWTQKPIKALKFIKEKSRDFKRIDREWYEVGVLDSI